MTEYWSGTFQRPIVPILQDLSVAAANRCCFSWLMKTQRVASDFTRQVTVRSAAFRRKMRVEEPRRF